MNRPANPRAFPSNAIADDFGGMTLRDWFAGQALAGMFASEAADVIYQNDGVARRSYAAADAMLVERAKATGGDR